MFDKKTAVNYFKRFLGNGMMEIDIHLIEESFIFSMMTVKNE